MKARVLAGGLGSRLRPITHTSAKLLVPAANKPVLFYPRESLRNVGVAEAGMIVGGTAAEIAGPAVIGAGARVVNSHVGPFTAIGADRVLSDTKIEYSIVLADSTVAGIRRIEGSLIGREVEVRPAAGPLQSYRLCLGYHSMVQIP